MKNKDYDFFKMDEEAPKGGAALWGIFLVILTAPILLLINL